VELVSAVPLVLLLSRQAARLTPMAAAVFLSLVVRQQAQIPLEVQFGLWQAPAQQAEAFWCPAETAMLVLEARLEFTVGPANKVALVVS
jgi:hypothetical protein